MRVDKPSDQALNELKRYTKSLLSFFDSKASVKISTGRRRDSVIIEVVCRPLDSEEKLNRIALERILYARLTMLYPDKRWKINLSIKKDILIN